MTAGRTRISIGGWPDARVKTSRILGVDRRIIERRVELNIIAWNIEAWVVENIECLRVVPQDKSVRYLERLEDPEIPAILE